MKERRERRIEKIRHRLLRKGRPRIQMCLMLLLTGLTGLFSSFVLLHAGLESMAMRYPLAIGAGYLAFLVIVGLWLWLQRRDDCPRRVLDILNPDFIEPLESVEFGHGTGGSLNSISTSAEPSGGASVFDVFDLEELGLIIVALLAMLAGVAATLYVVYIAPSLLAEVLVDGALVVGFYRRVKKTEQRHWLRTVFRRTVLPAIVVALFMTVAGAALQKAAPGAHTVGEVWTHVDRQ